MQGGADQRHDRAIQSDLKLARFPFIKTLDTLNGRSGVKRLINYKSKICFV
ncbi:MAG: hypothetical protein ACU843_12740 [Gammaproteobacteria bacterium]